jgi:hypothetical protein
VCFSCTGITRSTLKITSVKKHYTLIQILKILLPDDISHSHK